MRRYLTAPILAALFGSVIAIVSAPRDPHSYEIAAAAIIGAVSSGKKKTDAPAP